MSSSEDTIYLQEQPINESTTCLDACLPTVFFPSYSIAILSAGATKGFSSFRKLPIEIQHSIWEEALPESRVFDNNTLRFLEPQHGMICFDLIPSILQVCRDSRTIAQRHLCRTVLFQTWPRSSGRTICFNPERDIYRCRFTDFLWRHEFLPTQCLFSIVEIYVNLSLGQHPDTFGNVLRSVGFHDRFPHLKRVIVTNQHTHFYGDGHRDGWSEEQWFNQRKWDQLWRSVLEFLENRHISITISPAPPQIHGRQIADNACMPGIWQDEGMDTYTSPGILPKAESQSSISTLTPLSPRAEAYSLASPHVNSSAVVCHEEEALMPDPDMNPGPPYIKYRRADGSCASFRSFSPSGQLVAGKLPSLSA